MSLSCPFANRDIVNVPDTFVSRSPYYVVNNTKQIKPFLLLVEGEGEPRPEVESHGQLFKHDPALLMKSTWFKQPLQVVSCVAVADILMAVRKCLNKSKRLHS